MRPVILILSHSSYSDLWNDIELHYSRLKLNESFDIYLSTDRVPSNIKLKFFKPLIYETGHSWLEDFKFSLNFLYNHEITKAMVTFDDLLITNIRLDKVFDIFLDNEDDLVSLTNNPSKNIFFKFFRRLIGRDTNPYIGSLVFSIIRTEYFIYLLHDIEDNWSPWEYERNIGEVIKSKLRPINYKGSNEISYLNLVKRGQVNPFLKWYLRLFKELSINTGRKNQSYLMASAGLIYGRVWSIMNHMGLVNYRR